MSIAVKRAAARDQDWLEFSHEWLIRADTTYLNHGSFGPPSQHVRQARRSWIDQLDCQPMDFFVRRLEPAMADARQKTAEFVGTRMENLVFVENATFGMNVVADSFPLEPGDEVLLNNHEYGAVHRIWNRACDRSHAKTKTVTLPGRIESQEQVIETLVRGITDQTRLTVISHITSPTALIMPIADICKAFADRGVAVLVDGPHAPAQVPLDLSQLECDFYTASCHKWLSATLGSGFLYVHPRWQDRIEPQLKSWGRLLPSMPERWDEEFTWSGTRDPSAYLSIPAAIEFMQGIGLDAFRQRSRWLATQAETMLCEEFKTTPIARRDQGWYGCMAHVPLPPGDWQTLQDALWNEYRIEVPIIHFEGEWFIRVSCHLYNNTKQLETLRFALRKLFSP